MKTLTQFIEESKMKDESYKVEQLFEGRKSVGAIKSIALFIKRKVIVYSKRVKSESDTNKKIDLLSSQCSALASLLMLNLAMEDEGSGLFSKGIIASGLFEEQENETIKDKEIKL